MIQMFTNSRIQETKMQYDTNVYHLQNIGDKDANTIQMFTTSRIQETKMQYDTNVYHLQNIGDKDAI